jgi:Fe2+ or Zn2+ uptake regulation protein
MRLDARGSGGDVNVERLVELLRAAGKRITPERVQILKIISAHPHADAQEIYQLACKACPRLSLSTVYRTANLLRELGVAEASGLGEGHRHFETRSASHYHCVCTACGRVIEMPPIDEVRRAAERRGFRVVDEAVELSGLCSSCGERAGRRTKPSGARGGA